LIICKIGELHRGKIQPETDGEAGLEVVRVMDAAERSVGERRIVDIVRTTLDRS
jgi:hypothetical protein